MPIIPPTLEAEIMKIKFDISPGKNQQVLLSQPISWLGDMHLSSLLHRNL
jgi:hypothetical protein